MFDIWVASQGIFRPVPLKKVGVSPFLGASSYFDFPGSSAGIPPALGTLLSSSAGTMPSMPAIVLDSILSKFYSTDTNGNFRSLGYGNKAVLGFLLSVAISNMTK